MSDHGQQRRMYLIDALPYVFRAYFSIRDMTSPDGQPVNAVYGFATFLIQLLQQESLTHIGVAFDESLTTSFRNRMYPAYKANREHPPAELKAQINACQAVARALGAPIFVDQQYEADDLIGALAQRAEQDDFTVVVVTNDKDLMQLVTHRVSWYDYAKKRLLDTAGVKSHMGVEPAQIPDLLGLQGDAVDNIPGVKGVGAKTAVSLLQAFNGIEDIYDNLYRVADLPIRGAKSIARKLDEGREVAFLSKQLATIARHAPASYNPGSMQYKGAKNGDITPLFESLGFRRLAQRISHWQT